MKEWIDVRQQEKKHIARQQDIVLQGIPWKDEKPLPTWTLSAIISVLLTIVCGMGLFSHFYL